MAPSIPFSDAILFLRKFYLRLVLISAALLIPCFWHHHVISCDLPSHTYNAWLATLAERGQAPSLHIAPQSNNVLFDLLLLQLCKIFGFTLGEKLAVSFCVLLFFWGAFALAAAASRRAPWIVAPLLAMVAYGWTFEIGFFNYYLSLALAFWGIAFLWRAPAWQILFAVPFAFLILMAHPIGACWFLGAVLFLQLSKLFSGWRQLILAALGIGGIFIVRNYLMNHYSVGFSDPLYLVNGIDQLILSPNFRLLAKSVLYFGAACVALDVFLRRRETTLWPRFSTPVWFYVNSLAAVLLLPDEINLPKYAIPILLTTMRLTSICAVSAICILAMTALRKWHFVAFSFAAVVFFSLLWREVKPIAAIETEAEQIVSQLPPNQRVIATIRPFPGSRFYFLNHLADRACIGKCFSYSNYEPSSGQFRVHALPGSTIVIASPLSADQMQMGNYVVQRADLPVYQIDQCTPDPVKLCMRELKEGEPNGQFTSPLSK